MLGQIGNWGGLIAISLGEEMLDWLRGYGTEWLTVGACSVRTDTTFDRGIMVSPAAEGDAFAHKVSYRPGNRLKRGFYLPHEHVAGLEGLGLPRFELHDVDFTEGLWGGPLSGPLDDCHKLPWPRLRKECDLYSCPEVFKRELVHRMRSALSAGQRGFLPAQRPPQRLIDTLRKGEWMDCMMEAGAQRLAA